MKYASPEYGFWEDHSSSVFYKALLFSLVVHIVLLLCFIGTTVIPEPRDKAQERISVRLINQETEIVPQQIQQESAAQQQEFPVRSDRSSVADDELETVEAAAPESAADPELQATNTLTNNIDVEQNTVAIQASPLAGGVSQADVPPMLNPAEIQQAIVVFSSDYRDELSGEWLADCERYRRKYGNRDCPQESIATGSSAERGKTIAAEIFRDTFRDQRQAGMREQLDQSNDMLKILAKDNPELASMAAFQINLNREKIAFLSGNQNTAAQNFVLISQRDNPNLGFIIGDMMQFTCKGGDCSYDDTLFATGQAAEQDQLVPAFEIQIPLPDRGAIGSDLLAP